MTLHANTVVDDATLSVSSEDSLYPIENVQDINPNRVWRSATGDTGADIDIPGTALTASYIAIHNHNLTFAGATITLMGDDAGNWGAPAFTLDIDWAEHTIIATFPEQTYDEWRLSISDGTLQYLEIGRLSLGTYITLPPMEPGFELPKATSTISTSTRSGMVYSDIGKEWREFILTMPMITDAQRREINSVFSDEEHLARPFFLVIFEAQTDWEPPLYCFLVGARLGWQRDNNARMWSLDMQIKEVV